jgi:hypothetical protein
MIRTEHQILMDHYAQTPIVSITPLSEARNTYRVALDRMDQAAEAVRIARIRIGQANRPASVWETASKAERQAEAMRTFNRTRTAQRRALAALGAAYDALVALDAAAPARVLAGR